MGQNHDYSKSDSSTFWFTVHDLCNLGPFGDKSDSAGTTGTADSGVEWAKEDVVNRLIGSLSINIGNLLTKGLLS